MTNSRRFATLLPLSVLFIAPAISGAQQHAPIAEQIGKAYGLDSFGQVEAIRYTFNIPELKLSRTWVWEPKTDTVTYDGPDKEGKLVKVTYKRDELSSQSDAVKNDIDPAFVNDPAIGYASFTPKFEQPALDQFALFLGFFDGGKLQALVKHSAAGDPFVLLDDLNQKIVQGREPGIGRAAATSSAAPPTMMDSAAFRAPTSPPETGASTLETPLALAAS